MALTPITAAGVHQGVHQGHHGPFVDTQEAIKFAGTSGELVVGQVRPAFLVGRQRAGVALGALRDQSDALGAHDEAPARWGRGRPSPEVRRDRTTPLPS